jgi:hypothetical protein
MDNPTLPTSPAPDPDDPDHMTRDQLVKAVEDDEIEISEAVNSAYRNALRDFDDAVVGAYVKHLEDKGIAAGTADDFDDLLAAVEGRAPLALAPDMPWTVYQRAHEGIVRRTIRQIMRLPDDDAADDR